MEEEKEIKVLCPHCKSTMELADVIDTHGGLTQGYYHEYCVYSCLACKKDFMVDLNLNFNPDNVDISINHECD